MHMGPAIRYGAALAWLALFPLVGAAQDPTNLMFYGGAYDGWDRDAMAVAMDLGGARPTLASGQDQALDWYAETATLQPVTITVTNTAVITNGTTLRLLVPASLALVYDPAHFALVYTGTAVSKVNTGSVSVSGDGRALLIPVTADFVANDTLTIAGLAVRNMYRCQLLTDRLGLDFAGDGLTGVYDTRTTAIRALWVGGAYDGWDYSKMADYKKVVIYRGTIFTF